MFFLSPMMFKFAMMSELQTSVQFLSGVGPKKAALFRSELGIETLDDLIHLYPFRYIDRSSITPIANISPDLAYVQVQGRVVARNLINIKHLSVIIEDASGRMELVSSRAQNGSSTNLSPAGYSCSSASPSSSTAS